MSLPIIMYLFLPLWIFLAAWTFAVAAFILYIWWRSRAVRQVIG